MAKQSRTAAIKTVTDRLQAMIDKGQTGKTPSGKTYTPQAVKGIFSVKVDGGGTVDVIQAYSKFNITPAGHDTFESYFFNEHLRLY